MGTVAALIPVWVRTDGTYVTDVYDSGQDSLVQLTQRPGGGEQLVIVEVELPLPREYVVVNGEVTE